MLLMYYVAPDITGDTSHLVDVASLRGRGTESVYGFHCLREMELSAYLGALLQFLYTRWVIYTCS